MQLSEVEKHPPIKIRLGSGLVFAVNHHRYPTAGWGVGATQEIDADNYVHRFALSGLNVGKVFERQNFEARWVDGCKEFGCK